MVTIFEVGSKCGILHNAKARVLSGLFHIVSGVHAKFATLRLQGGI